MTDIERQAQEWIAEGAYSGQTRRLVIGLLERVQEQANLLRASVAASTLNSFCEEAEAATVRASRADSLLESCRELSEQRRVRIDELAGLVKAFSGKLEKARELLRMWRATHGIRYPNSAAVKLTNEFLDAP